MTLFVILQLIAGFVLLTVGAEGLVRGAARLAALLGISPLIVGLTVVAFGTSAPELAVSTQAAFAGTGGIAIGNIIGSNIFNILFILGLSSLIVPLVAAQQLVRLDVPLMIAASFAFLLFALDGAISRVEGLVLVAGVIAYTLFLIRQTRRDRAARVPDEVAELTEQAGSGRRAWLVNLALIVVGMALLVLGARWLVDSAVTIARAFGVSDLIIGLTIIAIGTSLPEVATSVMASIKGERDIAVGNLVGSNLFNILVVLGVAATVAPEPIGVPPEALRFDLPVMVAVAVATLPIFFTGYRISRGEGALFLGYYVIYTVYLIMQATEHAALPTLTTAMVFFVIPLTVVTLAVLLVREIRLKRSG
jgi:cation:H+ antiporter